MYNSDLIIKRILNDLRNPANKIEGSLGSDNARAVGREFGRIYDYIEYVDSMHFVDTAEGEYLDRKALDYGLTRKGATNARGKVNFYGDKGTVIKVGTEVFSDTLTFKTLESGTIETDFVELECECTTKGKVGNVPAGAITKVSYLGVSRISNSDFTGGVETEGDEDFRNRLLLYIRYPGTSGNAYHYMHWALSVEGVGRVIVFPLWNGPGTVKVSIIDSNFRAANESLIQKVKNFIDPDDGMGTEIAPIGANLTVSTAKEIKINISFKPTLENGYSKENVTAKISEGIDKYFRSISYSGEPTQIDGAHKTIISYAKVIDIMLGTPGMLDVAEVQLNTRTANIDLGIEEIPILGEVTS